MIGGLPTALGQDRPGSSEFDVSWRIDGAAGASESRAAWPIEGGHELIALGHSVLSSALLGSGSRLALTLGTDPTLSTVIDLTALSALPVYENLVHCMAVGGAGTHRLGHTELRIRAQLRDDDRIEFAVQQRIDGGWSDNILPRARTMPAFGEATNWLSSTPISVSVDVSPAITVNAPEPVERPVTPAIDPVLRSGWYTASIRYAAQTDEAANLNSVVTVHGGNGLQLQLGCFGAVRRVQLAGAPGGTTGELTLGLDDAQSMANWNVAQWDGATVLRPADAERMIERMRGASTLSLSLAGQDSDVASFDLAGMFDTPIQANIDQCGNYTEPTWRPLTEVQQGQTDAGASYVIDYPDFLDGGRRSHVSVAASGEPSGADGRHARLTMYCQGGASRITGYSTCP